MFAYVLAAGAAVAATAASPAVYPPLTVEAALVVCRASVGADAVAADSMIYPQSTRAAVTARRLNTIRAVMAGEGMDPGDYDVVLAMCIMYSAGVADAR